MQPSNQRTLEEACTTGLAWMMRMAKRGLPNQKSAAASGPRYVSANDWLQQQMMGQGNVANRGKHNSWAGPVDCQTHNKPGELHMLKNECLPALHCCAHAPPLRSTVPRQGWQQASAAAAKHSRGWVWHGDGGYRHPCSLGRLLLRLQIK